MNRLLHERHCDTVLNIWVALYEWTREVDASYDLDLQHIWDIWELGGRVRRTELEKLKVGSDPILYRRK